MCYRVRRGRVPPVIHGGRSGHIPGYLEDRQARPGSTIAGWPEGGQAMSGHCTYSITESSTHSRRTAQLLPVPGLPGHWPVRHIANFTPYTAHCTLHTAHYIPQTAHYALHSTH